MASNIWMETEPRANVFPVDKPAMQAVARLVGEPSANLSEILEAARAAKLPVDAYAYLCHKTLFDSVGHIGDGCLRRLLLRHPGGFDSRVASALPTKSTSVRVIEPPEPITAHAKLYLVHISRSVTLAISGSSNATWHGFQRNVEANTAVLLRGAPKHAADPRAIFDRLWNEGQSWDAKLFAPAPLVSSDAPPLLPYQREAIQALDQQLLPHVINPRTAKLAASGTAVPGAMVALPTGAGKTVLAVRWLLQSVMPPALGKPRRYRKVLWLAHTEDLLAQASATFERQLNRMLDPRPEVHTLNSAQKPLRPVMLGTDVVFASRQLLGNRCKGRRKWPYFDVIVVDEAHHVCAATEDYPRILEAIPHGAVLGITATPGRTNPEENQGMYRYFSPPIDTAVPKKPLYQRTLTQLDGQDVRGRRVFSKRIYEEVKTGWTLNLKNIRTDEDLRRRTKFDSRIRVGRIAAHYNREHHFPALFFAVNIEDANAMTQALRARGVKAQAIHSGGVVGDVYDDGYVLSGAERREVVDLLRHRDAEELEAIVSVDMFIEGLDIPQLRSVFLARPTFSARVYLQMRGRGLRGPAVGGTPTCRIVLCSDVLRNASASHQLMNDARAEAEEALRDGTRSQRKQPAETHGVEIELAKMPLAEQAQLVHDALLFEGWLTIDAAVHTAADRLRSWGHLTFGRLRKNTGVYKLVFDAMERARKFGLVEARRGRRRAALTERDNYAAADWTICVIRTMQTEAGWSTAAELATDALVWAAEHVGLRYGHMSKSLKGPVIEVVEFLVQAKVILDGDEGLVLARSWRPRLKRLASELGDRLEGDL